MPYPVTFRTAYVEKRSRLTTFFRFILAIPHLIAYSFYGFAASVLVFFAWFALLFTGRYPMGMYDFVAGFLRYETRVLGYYWLLTDEYPPFSGDEGMSYPVKVDIAPPAHRYSRLKVLLRFILAIPVVIISSTMRIVAQVGAVIAWFAIVILGRQPQGLQDMIALGLGYLVRATAYITLLTEDWPPFTDETTGGVEAAPTFGALASSPPASGGDHPTSVPPGGYASPEREAAFPSTPPAAAAPEAPPAEPSVSVEPAESAAPGPPAPEPLAPEPPAAVPEPEPAEPSPPSPGDWPEPEPPEPRADDDEDEPPAGPFGPSSTNP